MESSFDREALYTFQLQVNEQVLQETNAILQQDIDRRRHLVYIILLVNVLIIAIVAGAAAAIVLTRNNLLTLPEGPCYENLATYHAGEKEFQLAKLVVVVNIYK